MDSLHEQVIDKEEVRARVAQLHSDIGCLLNDLEPAALLSDPFSDDCPIVGASRGFYLLSGYEVNSFLGSNCRFMLEGVPRTANSEGDRMGIRDFCVMCRARGLTDAELCGEVLLNSRKDGTRFYNLLMLGLCKVGEHTLILGVQMCIGEEKNCDYSDMEDKKEALRDSFKLVRLHLITQYELLTGEAARQVSMDSLQDFGNQPPAFAFYSERLQSHCLLLRDRYMAVRREPTKVPRGCLVFGSTAIEHGPDGLSFSLRVHQRDVFTKTLFGGLPLLGFTKRRPEDTHGLYPFCGHYCGSSVMVGADHQAFARDSLEHYSELDKRPSIYDVEMFSVDPSEPSELLRLRQVSQNSLGTSFVSPKDGDVLCCRYFRNGHIVLELNDEIIIAFDVERAVDDDAEYYAVVDLCLSVYSVVLVPTRPISAEAALLASAQIQRGRQISSESCLEDNHDFMRQ